MRGVWRGHLVLMVTAALVLLGAGERLANENHPAEPGVEVGMVLERLKRLEGTWTGEGGTVGGESNPTIHEFRVLAGDSVVLEIMDPDGEREVNVYFLDDDDLLLTHYCGGGNQPTLKLDQTSASQDTLPFVFSSVTNLKNPALDRHIHASKIVFLDPNRIESWWTVFKEGEEAARSKFVLTRSEDP